MPARTIPPPPAQSPNVPLPLVGRGTLRPLPVAGARPPTRLACLKCQLVGSRRLTCSKADACAELPHSYALGPILLALWLGTAIAFVVAVYGR